VLAFNWLSNHGTGKANQGYGEKNVPTLTTELTVALDQERSNPDLFQTIGKCNLRIEKLYAGT